MLSRRLTRTIGITLFGLAPLTIPVLTSGVAQSHGYTQSPSSRADACAQGKATGCGPIQWEPQSIEGPKGFPAAGPQNLCSADHQQFAQLDDPRNGQWPFTNASPGQDFQFHWNITAAHATTSFRYFVTKDGYNPSQPLTREQLEPEPFLVLDYGGKQPPNSFSHNGKLPTGKSGRHMIYAVWDIADTANAFYSCADVNFG